MGTIGDYIRHHPVKQPHEMTMEELDLHAQTCSKTAMLGCDVCAEFCERQLATILKDPIVWEPPK